MTENEFLDYYKNDLEKISSVPNFEKKGGKENIALLPLKKLFSKFKKSEAAAPEGIAARVSRSALLRQQHAAENAAYNTVAQLTKFERNVLLKARTGQKLNRSEQNAFYEIIENGNLGRYNAADMDFVTEAISAQSTHLPSYGIKTDLINAQANKDALNGIAHETMRSKRMNAAREQLDAQHILPSGVRNVRDMLRVGAGATGGRFASWAVDTLKWPLYLARMFKIAPTKVNNALKSINGFQDKYLTGHNALVNLENSGLPKGVVTAFKGVDKAGKIAIPFSFWSAPALHIKRTIEGNDPYTGYSLDSYNDGRVYGYKAGVWEPVEAAIQAYGNMPNYLLDKLPYGIGDHIQDFGMWSKGAWSLHLANKGIDYMTTTETQRAAAESYNEWRRKGTFDLGGISKKYGIPAEEIAKHFGIVTNKIVEDENGNEFIVPLSISELNDEASLMSTEALLQQNSAAEQFGGGLFSLLQKDTVPDAVRDVYEQGKNNLKQSDGVGPVYQFVNLTGMNEDEQRAAITAADPHLQYMNSLQTKNGQSDSTFIPNYYADPTFRLGVDNNIRLGMGRRVEINGQIGQGALDKSIYRDMPAGYVDFPHTIIPIHRDTLFTYGDYYNAGKAWEKVLDERADEVEHLPPYEGNTKPTANSTTPTNQNNPQQPPAQNNQEQPNNLGYMD